MYVKDQERCQTGKLTFRILAPSRSDVPRSITHTIQESQQHSELMHELQILRGSVYREYAGIAATLQADGRHWHKLDDPSWHILALEDGKVIGCARYRPFINDFDQLICSKAAVAVDPVTGPVFRSTFEQMVADARRSGRHVGEASAWALDPGSRNCIAAINIALMSFALAEWLGGGVGVTTASCRHHASSILKRLGGTPVANFEPYYEPMFDCSIELLRFNIDTLEERYKVKLEDMRAELLRTPIFCPVEQTESRQDEFEMTPAYRPPVQNAYAMRAS